MKRILKLSSFVMSFLISQSVFSQTYTIGVLESLGAGGYAKPDVTKVWDATLTNINKDNKNQYSVKIFSDISSLNDAMKKQQVAFAYAQSPGMITKILTENPDAKVLSTLLTEDQVHHKLLPYYYIYIYTLKSGLNITNTKQLHPALKDKTVGIINVNTKLAEPTINYLKDDHVKFVEKPTFYSAIDDILSGKLDALLTSDRVLTYINPKDKNKLQLVPVFTRPNGALVVNKNINPSISNHLVQNLINLPKQTLNEFHVKGFSKPLDRKVYLELDYIMPTKS